MVGRECKGQMKGSYAKWKDRAMLDEIQNLSISSANTYLFFPPKKICYSFTSNNLPYMQDPKEEIFTVTAYQEGGALIKKRC